MQDPLQTMIKAADSAGEKLGGSGIFVDEVEGQVYSNWQSPKIPFDAANEANIKAELNKYKYAFGIPPSYSNSVDPQYANATDTQFGRTYTETLLSAPTILSVCPGTVKYLPRTNKQFKANFITNVALMAKDDSAVANLIKGEDAGKAAGQLYEFKSAYSSYLQVVNALARIVSIYMGIGDEVYPGSNIKYKHFDWGFYRDPSAAQNVLSSLSDVVSNFLIPSDTISDQTYFHFFMNGEGTNVTEDISTETRQSWLDTVVNQSLGESARDLQFLLGGVVSPEAEHDIDAIIDDLGSVIGHQNPIMSVLGFTKDYLGGARLVFPQMVGDVTYGKSITVTTKFISPSGDPKDIYRYVYIPTIFLLALSLPQQVTSNMYTYPFLCKVFCKGLYDSDLSVVTNLNITRGGGDDTSWTIDGLPTELTCSFTITPLYTKLMSSTVAHPLLLIENTSLMQYLAAICGVEMKMNNWQIKLDVAKMLLLNSIPDKLVNLPRWWIDTAASNFMRGFFTI